MNTIFLIPGKNPFVERITRWLVTKSGGRAMSLTKTSTLPDELMGANEDHILADRLLLAIVSGIKTGITIFNDIPDRFLGRLADVLVDNHVMVIDIATGDDAPEVDSQHGIVCIISDNPNPFEVFQRMEAIWKIASEEVPDVGERPSIPKGLSQEAVPGADDRVSE